MKKKLIIYYGDSPEYVEGFPKGCERSCKGSLHVLPRKAVTVTSDEYDHIQKSYGHMKSKLRVVVEEVEEKKQDDSPAKEAGESTDSSRKVRSKKRGKKKTKKSGKKKTKKRKKR